MSLFEEIVNRREEFMTLGDLCDENGEIKQDIKYFFNAFSGPNTLTFVQILQYGAVVGILQRSKAKNLRVLIPQLLLEDIPDYLSKDDFINYPIDFNEMVLDDYSKEDKRNDVIQSIHIVFRKFKVQFYEIKHINYELLSKLKIMCSVESSTGKHYFNVDMIEHWKKINHDDWITIGDMIIPKASSLYKV